MSIHFANRVNDEQINSEKKPTREEALDFLQRLTAPNGTLVMQLPSGIGLDFAMLADGLFEVEFYTGNPADASNASVTRETAERIIKRAYEERSGNPKDIYADLISEWNF
jgi:hypothetical protein